MTDTEKAALARSLETVEIALGELSAFLAARREALEALLPVQPKPSAAMRIRAWLRSR